MARSAIRQIVVFMAASGLLLGCVEGGSPFAAPKSGAASATAPAKVGKGGNRDVEAPDVFQITDVGLWDGRPSLGGVWVASPDTQDPERVIMRNPANGQTVVGALFRRERDNPGPKLQISSDAAEALGLLAGQPAEISVTALRREEVAEPDAVVTPEAVPETPPAGDVAPASPLDTAAIAAAALDKVDGNPAAGVTDEATGAAAVVEPPAVEPPAVEPPVKETRKMRRQKAAEAKAAAKAAAEAAANGAPLDATSGLTETGATIVPVARVAVTALPAADPAAKPAAKPETPAASAQTIQIGFFSLEANATRAVAELEKAGVPASSRKEESNGKVYWTVTARGDAAVLKKAKAAGFADAYFLK